MRLFLQNKALVFAFSLAAILFLFSGTASGFYFNYTFLCKLTPWKTSCENPIQARFLGFGLFTQGETKNVFQCMHQKTQAECEALETDDLYRCGWCDTPQKYAAQFGAGGCILKSVADKHGCAYLPQFAYEPHLSMGITLLPPAEEASCLLRSDTEENCTKDPECGYCKLPDVYGWKDFKNACLSKKLMPPNDDSKNWCSLAQRVPKGVRSPNFNHVYNELKPLLE